MVFSHPIRFVTPDGAWEFPTMDDATDFQIALERKRITHPERSKQVRESVEVGQVRIVHRRGPLSKEPMQLTKLMFEFVRVIAETGGLVSTEIAKRLNMGDARGIGPVVNEVRRALETSGFDPDRVLVVSKLGGLRIWKKGPDFDKAFKELQTETNGKAKEIGA